MQPRDDDEDDPDMSRLFDGLNLLTATKKAPFDARSMRTPLMEIKRHIWNNCDALAPEEPPAEMCKRLGRGEEMAWGRVRSFLSSHVSLLLRLG